MDTLLRRFGTNSLFVGSESGLADSVCDAGGPAVAEAARQEQRAARPRPRPRADAAADAPAPCGNVCYSIV